MKTPVLSLLSLTLASPSAFAMAKRHSPLIPEHRAVSPSYVCTAQYVKSRVRHSPGVEFPSGPSEVVASQIASAQHGSSDSNGPIGFKAPDGGSYQVSTAIAGGDEHGDGRAFKASLFVSGPRHELRQVAEVGVEGDGIASKHLGSGIEDLPGVRFSAEFQVYLVVSCNSVASR